MQIFPICNGELQGISIYYHPNGIVWKRLPHNRDSWTELPNFIWSQAVLLQTVEYVQGVKQGTSKRFWKDCKVAAEEVYCEGKLTSGRYYDQCETLLAQIDNGTGYRAIFGKESLSELQEYHDGVLKGQIKFYAANGALIKSSHMINNIKHGEEIEYYDSPQGQQPLPKLSIMWAEGIIQGLVKTWYPNGIQESQREMANNCKNGLLTAWYNNGNIMLIEEYDRNKLVKGEYFPMGEKIPVSEINAGRGLATLYDAQGTFPPPCYL